MNDPVKGCDVYKNIGCAHVDGFLCDYPNCSILKDYKMNERLAKLTEQCYEYNETMQSTWFNKTKFAELVVRECAKVCREQSNEYALEFDRENCASAIEEYFGVE
jgi:hypothetical protein